MLSHNQIERNYGSDVVQTLSRRRAKEDGLEQNQKLEREKENGLEKERRLERDTNDQQAKLDRQRGRDRDDDGFGF